MRMRIENGERLVVEVPYDNSIAYVEVKSARLPGQHTFTPLVDVTIENGLVYAIKEHVCRHPGSAFSSEDRAKLWAHIVSMHASMISPELPLVDLIEIHEHEHDGPGTIRNHPRESREYSLKKLGKVLSESER